MYKKVGIFDTRKICTGQYRDYPDLRLILKSKYTHKKMWWFLYSPYSKNLGVSKSRVNSAFHHRLYHHFRQWMNECSQASILLLKKTPSISRRSVKKIKMSSIFIDFRHSDYCRSSAFVLIECTRTSDWINIKCSV